MLRQLALLFLATVTLTPIAATQCVWGSFDSSRINYSAGPLTGMAHPRLRAAITSNGGSVGPATSTLTAAYLSRVQVFYTSLLHRTTGTLSAAEQTALQAWVAGGGTLIVTADYQQAAASASFTSYLGVTYTATRYTGTCTPTTTAHPITAGINAFYFAAGVAINLPANAVKLGVDSARRDVLAVIDPAGSRRGRVIVVGDHNLFTDSYIARNDNQALANNLAKFVCGGSGGCNTPASWANYGTGLAGRTGIPTLSSSANPVQGTTVFLRASNSSGQATRGLIIVGVQRAAVPYLGGTLLTSQELLVFTPFPSNGLSVPAPVPLGASLCGASLYVQVLQADSSAGGGVSFTPGLRLILGK